MITLWKELKKMIKLLKGSENTNNFGYKSIVANQLYLLYCFSGYICFTNRIHRQVKYMWYSVVFWEVLVSSSIGLWYSGFIGDVSHDLLMMYYIVISVVPIQAIAVGLPLLCYWYSDSIEKMIEHVDTVLTSDKKSKFRVDFTRYEIIPHAGKNLFSFVGLYFFWFWLYLLVCIWDVILFFDDDKIKNYLFLAYPLPLVEEFDSLVWFFFCNVGLSMIFTMEIIQLWSPAIVILYWNTVCCEELISIRNDLNVEMRNLDERRFGKTAEIWNDTFDRALMSSMKRFQNVIRLVNHFRGFTEIIATVAILIGFYYAVACLHYCLMGELPLMVKVKFFIGFMVTNVMMIMFYWMWQSLNNSVYEVSLAVYSTPWYQSINI